MTADRIKQDSRALGGHVQKLPVLQERDCKQRNNVEGGIAIVRGAWYIKGLRGKGEE